MTETLRFVGREFEGFKNALSRQAAAFSEPVDLDAQWLPMERLEQYLVGDGPSLETDLALVVTDWLPQLIRDGALMPLDPFLQKDPPQDWPEGWSPSMRSLQTTSDGTCYALPYHDGPVMFLYRGDLFDDPGEQATFADRFGYQLAAPTTWAEYVDIAKHFTRPQDRLWGTVLGGYPDGHNNVYDFLTHLWTRGGALVTDGEPSIDSSEGIDALGFLHDLWHEHRVVDPAALGWDSVASGQAFADGLAAMTVNWAGFAALSALPGSPTAGRIRCARVPQAEGPRGRSVSLNVYWVLAIRSECRDPELAWRFLHHLASPEMDRITSEEGATGTRLSTWRDPRVQAMAPYYEVLEDAHRSVESPPPWPEWPAVNGVLNRMVDDVLRERATPEAAAARGSQHMRECLGTT